ncbi:MAG TPA: 3-phosphoshikimate 1-carboxyvinyltransferase [Candidatus Binatia bacterium]|nr:3-phosphoshikimate 1-carboxyvinyltransferase [Candidatus Binatia bacterium]
MSSSASPPSRSRLIDVRIEQARRVRGAPHVPGDKSISHRALLFGALAAGRTEITGLLESEDVRATRGCLEAMGASVHADEARLVVEGAGRLRNPGRTLDCMNSGTTMRLLMGVLAGARVNATLDGDASLRRRPMRRVAGPLRQMGAHITLADGDVAPVRIDDGAPLHGIDYALPVASAQVKSSLLLAGALAEGTTVLRGLIHSRDHTERMLPHFGVHLDARRDEIVIEGGQPWHGARVVVPGDPSTAAFWIAAATIVPDSEVELQNILLNPTRIGFIDVLRRMGASIEAHVERTEPEPVGTLRVRSAQLRATTITGDEIPAMIDEVPLVAVLATFAHGTTAIRGAEELRVKESDRIETVAQNLRAMGAQVETLPDGFVIEGPQLLHGARIDTHGDHRVAMAFSIAALGAGGTTQIEGAECASVSYPKFYETLAELTR